MKSFAVDIATKQFSKKGEDICGDALKVARTPDSTIIVLSDGLGSGVKANVLATLTVEIACGLFEGELSVQEIVESLIATLPVCKWRNIAYSTFALARIFDTGHVAVAEYDSPEMLHIRKGVHPERVKVNERDILGKRIRESRFKLTPGDMLMMFTDGIVWAGVGQKLAMGWQEDGILDFVGKNAPQAPGDCEEQVSRVSRQAVAYWDGSPGDDGTVLCAKYREAKRAALVTGPPARKSDIPKMMSDFAGFPGAKLVCGGTTSHLVAQHLGKKLEMDNRFLHTDLPPTGKIEGVALVTEGILTLTRAREYLKTGIPAGTADAAAALLDQMLQADGISFMVGTARNPAHQNTGLPDSLFLRRTVVEDLAGLLEARGKETELVYY